MSGKLHEVPEQTATCCARRSDLLPRTGFMQHKAFQPHNWLTVPSLVTSPGLHLQVPQAGNRACAPAKLHCTPFPHTRSSELLCHPPGVSSSPRLTTEPSLTLQIPPHSASVNLGLATTPHLTPLATNTKKKHQHLSEQCASAGALRAT